MTLIRTSSIPKIVVRHLIRYGRNGYVLTRVPYNRIQSNSMVESESAEKSSIQVFNILIVDDEINIRKTLTIFLEAEGHKVTAVSNFEDAVSEAKRRSFDLAFVDLRLGTKSGLDLITALHSASYWTKIVVITAYASIESAVEAVRRGANDYIPKPFTPAQVKLAMQKVFALKSLEQRITALEEDLDRLNPEADFSTTSSEMQHALVAARQAASSDATILLRGESGTGKSVLARAIHKWSNRSAGPISIVSCPSFSSDLLESELFGHIKGAFTGAIRDNPGRVATSEGGTLFLDEIGDLPLSLQPKLLRFVQDKEYERVGDFSTRKANVRIIAATNVDLEKAVKEGRFREDLFYRLNVIQIDIPPLRNRIEDMKSLAQRLLAFYGRQNHRPHMTFTEEALEALRLYGWPGNLRELRNVVERSAIMSPTDRVDVDSLPSTLRSAPSSVCVGDSVPLDKIEEQHIRRILASTRSLQEAAEVLGIDQATLWRRRKKYDI